MGVCSSGNDAPLANSFVRGSGSASESRPNFITAGGLRKGKWTPEEEDYVAALIEHFESGLLNLVEGTTLRIFLAEKLNCDPMRITKKFTGQDCLGKRVYAAQGPQPRVPLTPAELAVVHKKLERAERRFQTRLEHFDDAEACMLDFDARFAPGNFVVSSPAIDALIMQSRGGKWGRLGEADLAAAASPLPLLLAQQRPAHPAQRPPPAQNLMHPPAPVQRSSSVASDEVASNHPAEAAPTVAESAPEALTAPASGADPLRGSAVAAPAELKPPKHPGFPPQDGYLRAPSPGPAAAAAAPLGEAAAAVEAASPASEPSAAPRPEGPAGYGDYVAAEDPEPSTAEAGKHAAAAASSPAVAQSNADKSSEMDEKENVGGRSPYGPERGASGGASASVTTLRAEGAGLLLGFAQSMSRKSRSWENLPAALDDHRAAAHDKGAEPSSKPAAALMTRKRSSTDVRAAAVEAHEAHKRPAKHDVVIQGDNA